ncbi:caspase family protein [Phormidesmis priestleyi]
MRVDPLDDLKCGRAKLWMLLIGVNDYDDARLGALKFATADCQGFAEALDQSTVEFPEREIFSHFGVASQKSLSRSAVDESLDRLLDPISGIKPQDTVLFYFAGHGVLERSTQKLYLCLTSTRLDQLSETGLDIQFLLQRLRDSGVGKQVIVLDACHSGTVEFSVRIESTRSLNLEAGSACSTAFLEAPESSSDPNFTPRLEATLQSYATQNKDFYALLSCSGTHQQSWEFTDLQHGVFTHYLIRGLQGDAADEQGRIDIDRLYRYVRDCTEEYVRDRLKKSQIPSHIQAGYRDIMIGMRSAATPRDLGSLSDREKQYSQAVWQALKQNDPIAAFQPLRVLAEELLLPRESIDRIEAQETQHFERDLQNYQQRAIALLHQSYPHGSDPFSQLRRRIGLKAEMLTSYEQQAFQKFTEHQQTYQSIFLDAICQQGLIDLTTRQRLQDLQQQYELSDTVVTALETEIIQIYNQNRQEYQNQFFDAIRQQFPISSVSRQHLQKLQQSLGLGNAIVADIEQAEIAIYQETEFVGVIQQVTYEPIPLEKVTKRKEQSARSLQTILSAVAVVGSLVAIVPYQQWQADRKAESELDRIKNLAKTDRQACIDSARVFPENAHWNKAQTLLNQCEIAQNWDRFNQAKDLAEQGKLQSAITIARQIPQDSGITLETKKRINLWAKAILKVAAKHYEQGKFGSAIEIAKAIPKNTTIYQQGQLKINQWSQDWKANQVYVGTAKKAQSNQEWSRVLNVGKQVKHPYWRKQVQPLMQEAKQAQREIQTRLLRQAISSSYPQGAASSYPQGITQASRVRPAETPSDSSPRSFVTQTVYSATPQFSNSRPSFTPRAPRRSETPQSLRVTRKGSIPPDEKRL